LNFLKSIVGSVTFVDIKPFYVINSDVVSLFAYLSFLVFSEFENVIILIDVLYRFECMNTVVFNKKIVVLNYWCKIILLGQYISFTMNLLYKLLYYFIFFKKVMLNSELFSIFLIIISKCSEILN
jgi:hypothetical protein